MLSLLYFTEHADVIAWEVNSEPILNLIIRIPTIPKPIIKYYHHTSFYGTEFKSAVTVCIRTSTKSFTSWNYRIRARLAPALHLETNILLLMIKKMYVYKHWQ